MAIRQDSKSRKYFFDVYYDDFGARRRHRSKLFGTKKEAKEEERRFLNEMEQRKAHDYTFGEMADLYLEAKQSGWKLSTYRHAVRKLAFVKRHLGQISMQRLTVAQFNEFMRKLNTQSSKQKSRSNRLKKAWSERQKNAVFTMVKALCKFAQVHYGIDCTIPFRFERWKVPVQEEKRYLTLDEFNQFLEHVEKEKYRLFFTFLMFTGLRRGEALGLQFSDIDFSRKTARIHCSLNKDTHTLTSPKNRSSIRTIPLCQTAFDCVVRLKEMYCSAYVFGGRVPFAFTTIDRVKNKACDDAGMPRFRLHDLRHSFVSLLVNSGADIYLIATYVGHSDVEQTLNTYSHLYTSRMDAVVSALDTAQITAQNAQNTA